MRKLHTMIAIVMVSGGLGACHKTTPEQAPPAGAPAAEPRASGPCVLHLVLGTDKLAYDGGGLHGQMPRARGSVPDISSLAPSSPCRVSVWADDEVSYQEVIEVMDAMVKHGVTDLYVGSPTEALASPPTHDRTRSPSAPSGWTTTMTTTNGGKLELRGHRDPTTPSTLELAPVIVITRTDVTVAGHAVAKPSDSNVDQLVASALPPNPKDPTLILQADKSTSFFTIRQVVKGAQALGYDNLMFAVKGSSAGQTPLFE